MDRFKNVEIIKGLFGLDRDLLNDSIGYKGNDFDMYSDVEIEKFANYSLQVDSWIING